MRIFCHSRIQQEEFNPDSAVEVDLGILGQPFRSEDNTLVPLSHRPWPVHGVAVSKQGGGIAEVQP